MHFSEHQHPFGPERWVNRWRASLLSPFGHSHCCCRHRSALFESTFLHPFAPSPLRDFFAPMGALTPAQPGSSGRSSMNSGSFSEQLSLIHASGLLDHSVSNHLMRHCRRFHTLPFSSTASRFRSRLRPCIAGSPITPGRIEFVILRTGRSPPAAPHHASLRRSCTRFQAGERIPEEDLHLSVCACSQAHMPRPCAVEVHASSPITANLWTKSSKRETPRGKPVASRKILWISNSNECESPRRKAVASVWRFHKSLYRDRSWAHNTLGREFPFPFFRLWSGCLVLP
jgi:hypothetical protein